MEDEEITYTHHKYDINLIDCFNAFFNRMNNERLIDMVISVNEYQKRLKIAIQVYAKIYGYQKKWTEIQKKHFFYVNPNTPSFDFWLALQLTIVKKYQITLILDYFLTVSDCSHNEFINKIEFNILNIQNHNVFFNIDNVQSEISKWVTINKKVDKLNDNIKNLILSSQEINLENIMSQLYNEKKIEISNTNEIDVVKVDDRIKSSLSDKEILEYFMQLNKSYDSGEVILSKKDIKALVESNFTCFTPVNRKLLEPKIGKDALKRFIYDLYIKDGISYNGRQTEFCNLLINNFKAFNKTDLKTLSKKLSTAPPKRYPFN